MNTATHTGISSMNTANDSVNSRPHLTFALSLLLAACGGGGSGASTPPEVPPAAYTVGGTVSGLTGAGLSVQNNNVSLAISAEGSFTLPGTFAAGASYAVSVATQPGGPAQTCTVANGSGIVGGNVTDIIVSCATNPMTLLSSVPADNAIDVDRAINPSLTFSVPLDGSTAPGNVILRQSNQSSATNASASVTGNEVSLVPQRTLMPLSTYSLSASTALTGAAGEPLAATAAITFTTRDGSWQSPMRIDISNTGDALVPMIAMDASGNGLAVWHQSDGTRNNIWANRYTAGAGWGSAELIETNNSGNAHDPQIAIDVDGNALAVWSQVDSSYLSIWANRYTPGGGWGVAELIETYNGSDAYDAKIVIDSKGNALAVWEQNDGLTCAIAANRYTPGSGWGSAALIFESVSFECEPQIAVDANGNALAVWTHYDGATTAIWANRYVEGIGWGSGEAIQTGVADNAYAPQIGMDANGNALAVWQQQDGTPHYDVMANRYSVNSGWGTAMPIGSGTTESAFSVQIAMNADGNAVAVWNQFDGKRNNVWASHYYKAGTGWVSAELIETDDTGTELNPQVAVDANGHALALWYHDEGTRFGIRANRFVFGDGWGSVVQIDDGTGSSSDPRIVVDANGSALAVWQQNDGTLGTIWANGFE